MTSTSFLAAPGPFVIDVIIDASEVVPSGRRSQSLEAQGVNAAFAARSPGELEALFGA